VLDLYCGSGALGLEALSRGADAAVFVDSDPQAVSVARANAKAAGLEGSSAFRKRDATRYVAGGAGRDGPFDLVFMDPPYSKRLDPALRRSLAEIVADRGRVVLEQRKGLDPPEAPQGFIVEADRQYGDTRVLVFRRTEAS
jgi:16S rRNA (guanine966-N2)-methyltransferase